MSSNMRSRDGFGFEGHCWNIVSSAVVLQGFGPKRHDVSRAGEKRRLHAMTDQVSLLAAMPFPFRSRGFTMYEKAIS